MLRSYELLALDLPALTEHTDHVASKQRAASKLHHSAAARVTALPPAKRQPHAPRS